MFQATTERPLKDALKIAAIAEGKTRVVSSKRDAYVDASTPDILAIGTIKGLVETLGEELVVSKVQAQLIVDFRAMVRGKMESFDKETEDFRYDLAPIESEDYTDWKPELTVRKSAEEKAADLFGKLTPDQIKAALAKAGITL